MDIGINQTLIRMLNLNREKESTHFGNAIILKSALAAGVYCVMAVSLLFTNYNQSTIYLTYILGIARIGNMFQGAFISLFDSKERFVLSSVLNSSFSLSYLTGTVMVILASGSYYQIAQVRAGVVVAFIAVLAVFSLSMLSVSFSFKDLRSFVLNALPFSLSTIFSNTYRNSNIIILSMMMGTLPSGAFNNGYIFFISLFFIPINMNRVLLPYLYKLKFAENKKKFQFAHDIYAKAYSFISFGIILFFWGFGEEIIRLLYGSKYDESIMVVKLVSLAIPFVFSPATVIITALDKQRYNTVTQGIAAIVNVLASVILIWLWGINGAAVAVVLTYGMINQSAYWYLVKNKYIRYRATLRAQIKLTLVVVTLLVALSLVRGSVLWLATLPATAILYCLAVVVLLIRSDDIRVLKETLKK